MIVKGKKNSNRKIVNKKKTHTDKKYANVTALVTPGGGGGVCDQGCDISIFLSVCVFFFFISDPIYILLLVDSKFPHKNNIYR